MKKLPVFLSLLFVGYAALSQDVDSVTIVNLKKKLPSLKDTARINCLLDIAGEYSNWGHNTEDTVKLYVSIAKRESEKINYKYGIASALLFAAGREVFVNKDLKAADNYINAAKVLGESIDDPKLLGWIALTESELFIRRKDPGLIDLWKKALNYFEKAGDTEGQAEASNWIGSQYLWQGDYEKAFPYCQKSIELSKLPRTHKISWGHFLIQFSLGNMAELYKVAGDYETALNYLRESNAFATKYKTGWNQYADIAEMYSKMENYDSAMIYWNKWRNDPAWSKSASGHKAFGNNILASIYIRTGRFDEAIPLSKSSLDTFIAIKNFAGTSIPLLALAEAYAGKKDFVTAATYATACIDTARNNGMRPQEIEAYRILSFAQRELGDYKKAFDNLLKYTSFKDSSESRKFMLMLNNYRIKAENEKKQATIVLLQKNEKIRQEQLKQEATLKYFLMVLFLAFAVVGIFVYRNLELKRRNDRLAKERIEEELKMRQLENDKKQTELEKLATELEMQALRTQMNPHFIFNCLSSINRFILKNETEIASDYLTRFSRLIRMVLINSRRPLITLEDELEMLRLYLDLERMRFHEGFDYHINFKNTIDVGDVLIPPLILQPFCENAIWHGLMQKEGAGRLEISLNMEDNVLHCSITDNGIGREKAEEIKSKSVEKDKSLGLKITSDRLDLFNRNDGMQTSYHIEDLHDENGDASGTRVNLRIRYEHSANSNI